MEIKYFTKKGARMDTIAKASYIDRSAVSKRM